MFTNEDWSERCSAKDVNIVLVGADLDILSGLTINKAQPRLVLATFDCRSELQYEDDLLRLSLRGRTPGPKEHQLERLTLAVSRLDVPQILGQDFCYLFSSREQEIQTKYCYWRFGEKDSNFLLTGHPGDWRFNYTDSKLSAYIPSEPAPPLHQSCQQASDLQIALNVLTVNLCSLCSDASGTELLDWSPAACRGCAERRMGAEAVRVHVSRPHFQE